MKPIRFLKRLCWVSAAQCGIDPRAMLRSLLGVPRYLRDFIRFRNGYSGRLGLLPCLHDWYQEGGATKNEYFWQDLLVARMIFEAKPDKHVDIGSRVDGFVAHVASFRQIEVFDVRPITTQIPGVIFTQADLMRSVKDRDSYCDSLSCLHALEHFGLGRYGDPIDPDGFARGLSNMASLLRPGGLFYLSLPIGIERVEFNAQRVCDPRAIIRLAAAAALRLSTFVVIQQDGRIESIGLDESRLCDLATQHYSLGLFTFTKRLKA